MKQKLSPRLKMCRARHPAAQYADDTNGAFLIKHKGARLYVIISDGMGWDHVSVSVLDEGRCPTWAEMCHIKDLFFEPEETVIQYHPPKSEYINHADALHMWRPQGVNIPMPPLVMV